MTLHELEMQRASFKLAAEAAFRAGDMEAMAKALEQIKEIDKQEAEVRLGPER